MMAAMNWSEQCAFLDNCVIAHLYELMCMVLNFIVTCVLVATFNGKRSFNCTSFKLII